METHFQKELEELKEDLLKMTTLVEEAIRDAVQSMVKKDTELAQKASKKENQINSDPEEHTSELQSRFGI